MASPFSNQGNSLDVFIRNLDPDTNENGFDMLLVGKSTNVDRSLIKWDLSSIPANATVTSAILSVYKEADVGNNTRTMRAYRVKRAWVEAQATWNSYSTGNAWGTAGCGNTSTDREATDIGSVSVDTDLPNNSEVQISLTPSAVQGWISGAFANNGVLLQMDTEDNDVNQFFSHEDGVAGTRPKLVIEYTLGGGGFFALL